MQALLTQHIVQVGQEDETRMLVSWDSSVVTPTIVESSSDSSFYMAFPKAKTPVCAMLKAPELQTFTHSQLTKAMEDMNVLHMDVSYRVAHNPELIFKCPSSQSSYFVVHANDRFVVHSTEWLDQDGITLNKRFGEMFAHHMISPIKMIESGVLRAQGLDCYAWLLIKDGKLVLVEV